MSLETLIKEETMSKKYLITGAQYLAPVNHQLLDSMESYAKAIKAEILVLPVKYKRNDESYLHERLQNHNVINSNYRLCDSLQIAKFDVRPQSIEPITGFSRFAKSNKTTIFASPKQRLKVLPNNLDMPKVLMTTGFVTKPQYDNDFAISAKATNDHKYGFVYVEVFDNKHFHYRHVNAQVNGKFVDLGVEYTPSAKSSKVTPIIVFGDIHAQDIDKKIHKENINIIKNYKPSIVVLHDLFDGKSINHWSVGKSLSLAREYDENKLSIIQEAKTTLKVLNDYASNTTGKVYVVKSNHDERINRWLEEGRYLSEPQNLEIGHKLWLTTYQGKDPLKELLSSVGSIPDNVVFLSREDSLKKYGVELGYHGDERFNGGKGSIQSKEHAYGKSVTGHTHSPEILRDTYVVGTCTPLSLDYNSGNSGWMNTSAFVYPNGMVQLFNYVKGFHKTYK